MKLRQLFAAAALVLLPLTASAATLVIPASGTGAGSNGSNWQTEVTVHNVSNRSIEATLIFHSASGSEGSTIVTVPARATTSVADIVKTRFGKEAATGAIEVRISDESAAAVAVTSRTSNVSEQGEFGQDIPAINVTDAARIGDLIVLTAPSSAEKYRFNAGLYAVDEASIFWELVRADGTTAGTTTLNYRAGTQRQYNLVVPALFGAAPQDGDSIHATIVKGAAIFYGSSINQLSGDPAFVPAVRVREDFHITFLGVDLDENGTVDVADANHDGVLDQPIDVFTSLFPNFFRIVGAGENGQPISYELIDAPRDAMLVDGAGTIEYAPGGNVKGTSGQLRVRATSGGRSQIFVIPINFR